MKATNAAAESDTQHPPLAHDVNGNRLSIPPGTCTWQIGRHTEGRPKIIKGPDKEPARFPLDTTAEDLADACGADTYRIYAADAVGKVISHVTNVEVGREQRNAAVLESALIPTARGGGGAATSDLRYALEAITTIARTNADAMRAVVESQADWIKSISSARGFFRNAAPLALPAPVEPKNDNEDDDDDDEEEDEDDEKEETSGMDWVSMLEPVVGIAVEKVVAAVMGRGGSKDGGGANLPFELGDLFDWRRAAKKREQATTTVAAPSVVATLPAAEPERSPDPKAIEQALIGKAMAIGARLAPADRIRLFKLARQFSKHMNTPEVVEMLGALVPLPVEEAAEWVRAHLDELEKMFAS